MMRTHKRRLLWAVLGLALAARLAAVALLSDFSPGYEVEAEIVARVLVEHGFYGMDWNSVYAAKGLAVTSFIPPLYPFFLAGMRLAFGAAAGAAVRVTQALLGTLSVGLTYALGRRLFGRLAPALAGALLAAIFPPLVGAAVEISTVTFEVLWVLVFVVVGDLTPKRGFTAPPPSRRPSGLQGRGSPDFWGKRLAGWMRWALAGAALGLAGLTRTPNLMVLGWLPLSLLAAQPAGRRDWRAVLAPTLIAGAAAALVIAPWTVRNYLAQGELVLISSNGGINFWIGNNPQATGEFIWPPEAAPDLIAGTAGLSEAARDRFFYREGLRFALDEPARFVGLLARKALYTLWVRPSLGATYDAEANLGLARLAYTAASAGLLPLWGLGLALTARQWRRLMPLYGPIVVILAVNVLYFAGTRFRTPAAPYQLLLAGWALAWVARRWRQEGRKLLAGRQAAD